MTDEDLFTVFVLPMIRGDSREVDPDFTVQPDSTLNCLLWAVSREGSILMLLASPLTL